MLPSVSREIWGLSLSTRVCLCPSVPLSFSLALTSQCLVCVSRSSYWSLFLKRAILTCWRSTNTRSSAWPARIVFSLKWAGLLDTLQECMQDFLEVAVIVTENGSSGTGGNVQDCGPALYPVFARSPWMLQIFLFMTQTLLTRGTLCIRVCALTASRNLPPLPNFVHKKECRAKYEM